MFGLFLILTHNAFTLEIRHKPPLFGIAFLNDFKCPLFVSKAPIINYSLSHPLHDNYKNLIFQYRQVV